MEKKINVVLVEPEIPQNTGNIARTCAATDSALHLVKPLGFKIDDAKLKRAGLDYWYDLDIHYYDNLAAFMDTHKNSAMFFYTTKAPKCYTDIDYTPYENVYLLFGRETAGLPESLLRGNIDNCVRIPMKNNLRSLNLSNAVAVAVYEVLRGNGFEDLRVGSDYLGEK
jgi:tRNA (cytidine/uridine-2'-O-)-methyltransferase